MPVVAVVVPPDVAVVAAAWDGDWHESTSAEIVVSSPTCDTQLAFTNAGAPGEYPTNRPFRTAYTERTLQPRLAAVAMSDSMDPPLHVISPGLPGGGM